MFTDFDGLDLEVYTEYSDSSNSLDYLKSAGDETSGADLFANGGSLTLPNLSWFGLLLFDGAGLLNGFLLLNELASFVSTGVGGLIGNTRPETSMLFIRS